MPELHISKNCTPATAYNEPNTMDSNCIVRNPPKLDIFIQITLSVWNKLPEHYNFYCHPNTIILYFKLSSIKLYRVIQNDCPCRSIMIFSSRSLKAMAAIVKLNKKASNYSESIYWNLLFFNLYFEDFPEWYFQLCL